MDFAISYSDIPFSFDVVSLLTDIPILETLHIRQATFKPPQHIMELTKHCLTSVSYTHLDVYKRQTMVIMIIILVIANFVGAAVL